MGNQGMTDDVVELLESKEREQSQHNPKLPPIS